jgi:hypothetical protein
MIDLKNVYITYFKKSYKIKIPGSDLIIKTPICTAPFGEEIYNGKCIINLEFCDNFDFLDIIREFEKNIHVKFPEDFGKNKTLYSNIKDRSINDKKVYHIRTHIANKNLVGIEPNKKMEVELKMDSIWENMNEYGVCMQIVKITYI